MKEIVINGVNLNDLKAKQEAYNAEVQAVRLIIQKDAAAYVAERIQEATTAVSKLRDIAALAEDEPADEEAIIALAKEATEALVLAQFVAGVAAISFSLPFSDTSYAYGGYSSEDIITCVIEEIDINGNSYWELNDHSDLGRAINALYKQAENMESEVQEWNSSYC